MKNLTKIICKCTIYFWEKNQKKFGLLSKHVHLCIFLIKKYQSKTKKR